MFEDIMFIKSIVQKIVNFDYSSQKTTIINKSFVVSYFILNIVTSIVYIHMVLDIMLESSTGGFAFLFHFVLCMILLGLWGVLSCIPFIVGFIAKSLGYGKPVEQKLIMYMLLSCFVPLLVPMIIVLYFYMR